MTLKQAQFTLELETRGRGLTLFTAQLDQWLLAQKADQGLLTIFIQHTSASLLIQENADDTVRSDLETFFSRLVKDGDPAFRHDAEGPDDMPSHIRAALTQTQLSVPVRDGKLALGTWQGVYLYEHRHAPHRRRVLLHYLGS